MTLKTNQTTKRSQLAKYIATHARRKEDKRTHTHTAFGGVSPTTLHVELGKDGEELHQALFDHVCRTQDLSKGANSLTEKVPLDGRFRLFLDIDFKIEAVETFMSDRDETQLINELRKVPECVKRVITNARESDEVRLEESRMIMATRLPYKIHLHFPDIIMTRTEAKRICELVKLELEASPLYDASTVDTSVYSTGLRLLWCHKGAMAKAEKTKSELELHEKMFHKGSWTAIYEVTDATTWDKKQTKTLSDLADTSIVAGPDAELTRFRFDTTAVTGKAKVPKATMVDKGTSLLAYLERIVSIPASDIRTEEQMVRGGKLIIPTRHRHCPLANREHSSNQQYLVVTEDSIERRCHDEACTGKMSYPISRSDMKLTIQHVLSTEQGSEPSQVMKLPRINGDADADAYLSASLNTALLKHGEWITRKHEGRKNTSKYNVQYTREMERDCLQRPEFLHEVPGTCCLQVSGKLDVNIRKAKDTDQARLIDKLYTRAADEGLRRDRSNVYRPVPGKPCCYIMSETHESFIHRVFSGDPLYISRSTNQSDLERSFRSAADPRAPFIEMDLNLIGVGNGLIHIEDTPRFTAFKDVDEELRRKTARTFIDVKLIFDETSDGWARVCDNWNRLVQYQVSEEIQSYLMALMGRTLHKLDDMEIFLYLMGRTRTGKSTIIKLLRLFHGADNVSNLSADGELTFGLGGKENKTLIAIPDMPLDINKTIAGSTIQSMVSGESVDVRKKGSESIAVDWKTHLIAAGNLYPSWPNTGNAIASRLVIIDFIRTIEKQDKRVQSTILKDEAANILWNCLQCYAQLFVHNPQFISGGFYDNCPSYFHEQRKKYEMHQDPWIRFIYADAEQLRDETEGIVWEIRRDENKHAHWSMMEYVFNLYVRNVPHSPLARVKSLSPTLDLWHDIGCTYEHQGTSCKDCPLGKAPHLCDEHHSNKRKDHGGKTTRPILKGLQLYSRALENTQL